MATDIMLSAFLLATHDITTVMSPACEGLVSIVLLCGSSYGNRSDSVSAISSAGYKYGSSSLVVLVLQAIQSSLFMAIIIP